jgi:hypothetical protein
MSKRSPKKRRRTLPALGLASVSLSMASGACAVIGEANASTPPQQTHEIFLAEEEISDVSLATFYVFDKEKPSPLQLARGGCGGGGGGCGHGGGCHGGGGGCGCHAGCAGCAHAGCAGGCHVGCAGGCGKVAHATISSGSRHSNSYAYKRGEWCGERHLRMTSASAVGQFGLAQNRCRTQFHPQRHRTTPSGQPVLSTARACASEVLPLFVRQPLAGNNLLDFVREARRPWQLESHWQPATNLI